MAEEVYVIWDLTPAGSGYTNTGNKVAIYSKEAEAPKKELESLGQWKADTGKGGPGANVYNAKISLISAESVAEGIETINFLYSGGNLGPGSVKRSGSACACKKTVLEFKSV